jgi:hypothetical protein
MFDEIAMPDTGTNWWDVTVTPQVNVGGAPNYDANSTGSPSSGGWGEFFQTVNKAIDTWGHVEQAQMGYHYPYTAESSGIPQTGVGFTSSPPPSSSSSAYDPSAPIEPVNVTPAHYPPSTPQGFDWHLLTDFTTPYPYVIAIALVALMQASRAR